MFVGLASCLWAVARIIKNYKTPASVYEKEVERRRPRNLLGFLFGRRREKSETREVKDRVKSIPAAKELEKEIIPADMREETKKPKRRKARYGRWKNR
jgi:hypothetical protein